MLIYTYLVIVITPNLFLLKNLIVFSQKVYKNQAYLSSNLIPLKRINKHFSKKKLMI
jgi:hypothetical protein